MFVERSRTEAAFDGSIEIPACHAPDLKKSPALYNSGTVKITDLQKANISSRSLIRVLQRTVRPDITLRLRNIKWREKTNRRISPIELLARAIREAASQLVLRDRERPLPVDASSNLFVT